MSKAAPSTGTVLAYPYLWRWQAEDGETAGRKDRPVCVMLGIPKGSTTHLVLLAISATPPRDDQVAVPIPPLECRRAGLREWKGGWVTVSEYNYEGFRAEATVRDPDAPGRADEVACRVDPGCMLRKGREAASRA